MQHDQCGVYKVYFLLIKLQWIKDSASSMGILYKVYMEVWLTSKYATENVRSVHCAWLLMFTFCRCVPQECRGVSNVMCSIHN
jgi:hypothetical protein